ncbi:MAG: tetratricopeptide repeat protein [Desulfomonilia bacterium]|jgi:tetratricopeptide (TPR) repeat protein
MKIELDAKSNSRNPNLKVWICLLLTAATLTVYWQVVGFDYINMDDPQYILDNYTLRNGVSLEGIRWAFSSFYASNWHPLTWISHMLDVQIFGLLNPGLHHITNVIFHILNTILLFLVLEKMTAASWRSAAVAALFAVHPLHVESVAWIAERKDVLSTFFWMLTMMSYLWYVQNRTIKRYLVLILFFILGLLSKPMIVTLPFVLLLLDFWPLNRLEIHQAGDLNKNQDKGTAESVGWHSRLSALVLEKIPLIVFAMISSGITMFAQKSAGSLSSLSELDFGFKMANVIISYASYLWKMIWPFNLANFYAYPEVIHPLAVILCAIFLLFVTVAVLFFAFRFPYLVVGWLWYIGTLVPVIGIVQVGSQSMADRYTYIPLIGIFLMIVWGFSDLFCRWRWGKAVLGVISVGVLVLLIAVAWVQVGFWKNSETICRHTIAVTKNNYMAYTNLGLVLIKKGQLDEAIKEFHQALRIRPTSEAYNGIGMSYIMKKEDKAAVEYLSKGVQIDPNNMNIHNNLGLLLASMGRTDEAIEQFQELLRLNPMDFQAHFNLGKAMLLTGKLHEAIFQLNEALLIDPHQYVVVSYLEKAKATPEKFEAELSLLNESLKSEPQNPTYHARLGDLYSQMGEYDDAIIQYQKAISIQPEYMKAMSGLVLIYSKFQKYDQALDVLKNMQRIQPGNPEVYYNIACIYAKQNMTDKSIEWLKQSIEKGFNNWGLIKRDPDLANIRNTSYFIELIKNH